MFGFKPLGDSSILTGIIRKDIFEALSEGRTTINVNGEEEKIDKIKSFEEKGPHIVHEGRENFIEVGFLPSENQNPEEIEPSEIFLSKIDLNGIKNDSFYSNILEIFDRDSIKSFKEHISEQFIKMKIKPIEQEGL